MKNRFLTLKRGLAAVLAAALTAAAFPAVMPGALEGTAKVAVIKAPKAKLKAYKKLLKKKGQAKSVRIVK